MIRFSGEQLNRLSEFTANMGLVFFATVVTPIFSYPSKINIFMIVLGLILMCGSLVISLRLTKGIKS